MILMTPMALVLSSTKFHFGHLFWLRYFGGWNSIFKERFRILDQARVMLGRYDVLMYL